VHASSSYLPSLSVGLHSIFSSPAPPRRRCNVNTSSAPIHRADAVAWVARDDRHGTRLHTCACHINTTRLSTSPSSRVEPSRLAVAPSRLVTHRHDRHDRHAPSRRRCARRARAFRLLISPASSSSFLSPPCPAAPAGSLRSSVGTLLVPTGGAASNAPLTCHCFGCRPRLHVI
jgi:hypothetical protein